MLFFKLNLLLPSSHKVVSLCDPVNYSPPGSTVHGIFQARILERVAISSSRGSSQLRDWNQVFCLGRWILYHWTTRNGLIKFTYSISSSFSWVPKRKRKDLPFNRSIEEVSTLITKSRVTVPWEGWEVWDRIGREELQRGTRKLLGWHICLLGFPGAASGKEPTCRCRRHKRQWFNPRIGRIPWRRAWQPTPVFLPGKSLGQRSLDSYSPLDHKE